MQPRAHLYRVASLVMALFGFGLMIAANFGAPVWPWAFLTVVLAFIPLLMYRNAKREER